MLNGWTGVLVWTSMFVVLATLFAYWEEGHHKPLRKDLDTLTNDLHRLIEIVHAIDHKIDRLSRPRSIADNLDDDPDLWKS